MKSSLITAKFRHLDRSHESLLSARGKYFRGWEFTNSSKTHFQERNFWNSTFLKSNLNEPRKTSAAPIPVTRKEVKEYSSRTSGSSLTPWKSSLIGSITFSYRTRHDFTNSNSANSYFPSSEIKKKVYQ